jgi:acetyl-CoA C-acetyltransferase
MHMGNCAELCADVHHISRQTMDQHAITTFQRAKAAHDAGASAKEVVAVALRDGALLERDESLSKLNEEKLKKLKPYFRKVCLCQCAECLCTL